MSFENAEPAGCPRFYAGRMLLAMPGMGDAGFDRAAIAICVHDEQGALGLNTGTIMEDVRLSDLMASLQIEVTDGLQDVPVLCGGPVEPERGFVLHSSDWGGQGSLSVNADWCLSGSLDVLKAIAEGRGPGHYLVALGYSGWSAGQLEQEMTRHGWFLGGDVPADLAEKEVAKRWESCFAEDGVDVRLLTDKPGWA